MAGLGVETAVMVERVREFDRVAAMLDLPNEERLGILNVSEEMYFRLCRGFTLDRQQVRPELERRLSYALRRMQHMVRQDTPVAA